MKPKNDDGLPPEAECCQDLDGAGFGDKDAEDDAEITTPGVA